MKYMPIVQSTNSKYLSFENETSSLVEDDSNFPFKFFVLLKNVHLSQMLLYSLFLAMVNENLKHTFSTMVISKKLIPLPNLFSSHSLEYFEFEQNLKVFLCNVNPCVLVVIICEKGEIS
jgi:hypothetical protein